MSRRGRGNGDEDKIILLFAGEEKVLFNFQCTGSVSSRKLERSEYKIEGGGGNIYFSFLRGK